MKRGIVILVGMAIAVVGLFCVAGTVTWWNAWVFLAIMVPISVFTQRLIKNSPGLAEEHSSTKVGINADTRYCGHGLLSKPFDHSNISKYIKKTPARNPTIPLHHFFLLPED